jgi:hypothetical protein
MIKNITKIVVLLALTACSVTRSSYVPIVSVPASPRETACVEYFAEPPKRMAVRLGIITVNGNTSADWDDIVKKAKKEAAVLGGDFILAESTGHDTQQVLTPGYTTYTTDSWCTPFCGFGVGTTSGYTVPPRIDTYKLPWATFAVYRYQPAQLGIRFSDEKMTVVSGFHLHSDAQEAGIQLGDVLLGIDQYDLDDADLTAHLLTIQPGDPVCLTLQRDSTRLKRTITAVRN